MTQTIAEQLEERRAALSHDPERPVPFRIVRDRLLPILGDYTPTEEALRQLHNGSTKRADPVMLAGLARVYGNATEARDRAIVAARAAGAPLRTIAEAAGITHQTVANIVERRSKNE